MSQQPNINPAELKLLGTAPERFYLDVEVVNDSTSTRAKLSRISWGGVIGTGTARRRKGDPRNQALGRRIAVARALRDAADNAAKKLADEGYEV